MKIINISKSYLSDNGTTQKVLDCLSAEIPEMKITCIMGASGSGKTTLLNIIAGLDKPDNGLIEGLPDKIAYLFQEPRLLGWKTVFDNVSIVSSREKAKYFLDLVELNQFEDKYPDELSGGQRQRVAIARALAYDAPLILMDEPFQNLDESIKEKLLSALMLYCKNNKKTVLWVTHDKSEAERLSDTVITLSQTG